MKEERREKFHSFFVISHQFANFLKIDTAQKGFIYNEDKKVSFLRGSIPKVKEWFYESDQSLNTEMHFVYYY